MNALTRYLFMVIVGTDLPAQAREPGKGQNIPLPLARDPLSGRLSAALKRLLAEGREAYENAAAVAKQFEALSESIRRRSTVSAVAPPGGVVPIRMEKAQHRQLRMRTVLIGTAIVTVVCLLTILVGLFLHHAGVREKEALLLWNKAVQSMETHSYEEALKVFERIVADYGSTEFGPQARQAISEAQKGIVVAELDAAFKKTPPSEPEQGNAAIRAEGEKLKQRFPTFDVDAQERVALENVRARYETAAVEEWKTKTFALIEAHCGRMQYGNARKEVLAYREKWAEATTMTRKIDWTLKDLDRRADEEYKDIAREVEDLVNDNMRAEAQKLLDEVIRNFGTPTHVRQAKELLKELNL
jgi:hypothetical protein